MGMTATDRRRIVIFSNEPWRTDAPTNKHQLAVRFARSVDVLYVNIGGRSVRSGITPCIDVWRDESGVIVSEMIGVAERARQHLLGVSTAQDWLAALSARAALGRLGTGQISSIAYFPMSVRALRSVGTRTLVYHCVDHHASVPEWSRQQHALLRKERALVHAADLVLASSASLADHCRRWRPDVKLLENVADVELFARAATDAPEPRSANSEEPRRPLAFFHGTFSVRKIDYALIGKIADQVPDLNLRLIGDAVDSEAARELAALGARPNVEWLGAMPQPVVVDALRDASLLLLPYATNFHTDHVFPLKLVEYLATGKPILATRLQSIASLCGDAVAYVDDRTDLNDAVLTLLDEPHRAQKRRRALVRGRTWDARALELLELLDEQALA